MTPEEQKSVVRCWYCHVLGTVAGPLSSADTANYVELHFAADYENHVTPAPSDGWKFGPDGARQIAGIYRDAAPDLRIEIEDEEQFVEGDTVTTRYVAVGTHTGAPLFGLAATGREYRISGTGIEQFAGDKIIASHGHWDTHALMQQMGILPPVAQVVR